ncbi:MAG: hypothetical protein NPIRA02_02610 [Nitrospirales bacterium]|nr:MAG: hypothetical protein NPIRA02_02610 [Nitrospirales bacterium]
MASGKGESTNVGAVFGSLGAAAGGVIGFGNNGPEGAILGLVIGAGLGSMALLIIKLTWRLLIGAVILFILFVVFSSRLCSFAPEFCQEKSVSMGPDSTSYTLVFMKKENTFYEPAVMKTTSSILWRES